MLQFLKKLAGKITGEKPDWESLEADLIQADFGAAFAVRFVEGMKKKHPFFTPADLEAEAKNEIRLLLKNAVQPVCSKPLHVIAMVGVNGAGKTTSMAKLAHFHKSRQAKVRLVAADTFRAAAIEQTQIWGGRIDVPVTAGAYGADPASIAFAGCQAALQAGEDVLIIDTAGRQHTKSNLMQELAKLLRAIKKLVPDAPHETLLVVDSNTGGNAMQQAKEFSKTAPLTGLVASKWDGAGAGGTLVAIASECGLQPQWLGIGEKVEDFRVFEVEAYLKKLFA